MDALANLKDHCPDWAKRIDELSGQIEQRQLELAELAARQHHQQQQQQQQLERSSDGRTGSKKSLRKCGSTESLRPPNEEGEAHPGSATTPGRTSPEHSKNVVQDARRASVASRGGIEKPQRDPSNGNTNGNGNGNGHGHSSSSPSTSERQANQVVAVASAKARATLRRTQLSRRRAAAAAAESLLSADGATPAKYRSRNLVIVYYDSYVQSFFEDLVKFVSASRNLMRKAKMAARVAQIKRMAELEMPDDDDSESSGEEPRVDGDGSATALFVPLRSAPVALKPDVPNLELGTTTGENKENGTGEQKDLKAPAAADGKLDERDVNGGLSAPSPAEQPYVRPATALNDNGNGNGNGNGHKPSPPNPRPTPASMSARPSKRGGFSYSSLGFGEPQQPDAFDELDKGLEFVQSMCEHAAHQFLRDGDCTDEIVKIRDRLNETKEKADREMERLLQQGGTSGALDAKTREESARNWSYRPQSVKRDALGTRARTSLGSGRFGIPRAESERPAAEKEEVEGLLGQINGVLEVDERARDNDEASEPPRFQYRSTRAMGPQRMAP